MEKGSSRLPRRVRIRRLPGGGYEAYFGSLGSSGAYSYVIGYLSRGGQSHEEDTLRIEDIWVDSADRKLGVGRLLVNRLIEVTKPTRVELSGITREGLPFWAKMSIENPIIKLE